MLRKDLCENGDGYIVVKRRINVTFTNADSKKIKT